MRGIFSYDDLNPVGRGQFLALANDLGEAYGRGIIKTLFLPFEGYRSPDRQALLFANKRSRARPYFSAHQYGLAVDFVPKVNGRWTWEVPTSEWDQLRRYAKARGLLNVLDWDRAHVEHPAFGELRAALWPDPPAMVG